MDERVEANRKHWDESVPIHVASKTDDDERFLTMRMGRLKSIELEEYVDWKFLSLLDHVDERWCRLTRHDGSVPLLYSIKATKPS